MEIKIKMKKWTNCTGFWLNEKQQFVQIIEKCKSYVFVNQRKMTCKHMVF